MALASFFEVAQSLTSLISRHSAPRKVESLARAFFSHEIRATVQSGRARGAADAK